MRRLLSDQQITEARALRASGVEYAAIREQLGLTASTDTIRSYCADVPVPHKDGARIKTRTDKVRQGSDGRTIRPFTPDEDRQIAAFLKLIEEPNRLTTDGSALVKNTTLADLARTLDRKRHSVAARIQTLKKHGKL